MEFVCVDAIIVLQELWSKHEHLFLITSKSFVILIIVEKIK